MQKVHAFAIEKVLELRKRCRAAGGPLADIPEGWSISSADPMRMLSATSLRLRPGYILRAYQFRSGGNGNAFVYAVPEAERFPEPQECQTRDASSFLGPPVPPNALPSVPDALEGDGSPWSYVEASILMRDLREFGAMWHGADWDTQVILGEDPLRAQPDANTSGSSLLRDIGDPSEWRWLKPKPRTWEPRFVQSGTRGRVVFHTFSGLGSRAIYRHEDEYQLGSYRFKEKRQVLASAPGGYVF